MKPIRILIAVAAGLAVAACSSGTDSTPATADAPTSTAVASGTVAVEQAPMVDEVEVATSTGSAYTDMCTWFLEYLDYAEDFANEWGETEWDRESVGEEMITAAPDTAEWSTLSKEDQDEAVRGMRAAVAGSC